MTQLPALAVQLAAYRRQWPVQADVCDHFEALLAHADAFVRGRLTGHFTASAWLVSADGTRTLLMHHAKLLRWLQPGGHADGNIDLARVALREAEEETGLTGLVVEDVAIFDLDRHWIPELGEAPGHWHHDVRYVVRALGGEDFVGNHESLGLAWWPVSEVADDPDDSLSRMARKWLAMTADPAAR